MPSHESPVTSRGAFSVAEQIRKRRISPVEVVEATLDRIARLNPQLNAFIAVFADQARQAARRAEPIVMQRGRALPPRIGETAVVINGTEVGVVDAFTRLNAPQNMAGIPTLSVPCGAANGLPVG